MNNSENTSYVKYLKEHTLYKQFKLKVISFENLEVAFDFILRCVNFKLLFIIISGRLYPDYFQLLNKYIKCIQCLPICIIFTSHRIKDIFITQKSQYYLSDEVLKSINNPFYNLGGVCSDFESCVNFIFNLYILLRNRFHINKDEKSKSSNDGCLTFECVYSKSQLTNFSFFI